MKSKITPSHSTMIPLARALYEALRTSPNVARVAAGPIRPARNAPQRIKVSEESGCLKMQVRGSNAIQDIRVYTQAPSPVSLLACGFAHKNNATFEYNGGADPKTGNFRAAQPKSLAASPGNAPGKSISKTDALT